MFAMFSAVLAGWFWPVGHLAGPVAAIYLLAHGRRRFVKAAAWPLAASAIALTLSLAVASSRFDSKFTFHSPPVPEIIRPVQGLFRTLQAIPENLLFGNLGLAVQTTPAQGTLLTLIFVGLWLSKLWLRSRNWAQEGKSPGRVGEVRTRCGVISPLESAGAGLVIGSYLVEWAFGGDMDNRNFRTVGLHSIVPWYHVIPQIGAVLWLAGWWSEMIPGPIESPELTKRWSLTRRGSLGLGILILAMLLLHRPRIDFLVRASVPPLLLSEQARFPILPLQMMRGNAVLLNRADWQRTTLRRLDRAQEIANRLGIGRDAIRAVFGHHLMPASADSIRPERHDSNDTSALLDIAQRGRVAIPSSVFKELTQLLAEAREPRPQWIADDEKWPPAVDKGEAQ